MNRKLTDAMIEQTWCALALECGPVSGRQLRAALRARYGTPGRTDRVYALWRGFEQRERATGPDPAVAELQRRVAAAEARASEAVRMQQAAEQRAALAEEREIVHQDRWANEIYDLRQELERLKRRPFPV